MTDRKIPERCRTCKNCQRFVEIPAMLPLYDWEPWEWRCPHKNSLRFYEDCPNYEKT